MVLKPVQPGLFTKRDSTLVLSFIWGDMVFLYKIMKPGRNENIESDVSRNIPL